jgi:D-alanyl-D-alanine dipeptidase
MSTTRTKRVPAARLPGSPREPGITRLCRVPTVECGEPLVDLCKACPRLVVKAVPTFIRVSVAQMLNRAQALLPPDRRIRVSAALRTLEQQSRGYWAHYRSLAEKHPEWPHSILRREANKFWHPPDMKAVPGHCTGGAVDVTLLDETGEPLDMTSADPEGANTQATYTRHLTPVAQANRDLLIRVMLEAGFSNCYDEWWHWSYGDAGWACRLGYPHAIYGLLIDVPEEALRQIEERRREEEQRRAAQNDGKSPSREGLVAP